MFKAGKALEQTELDKLNKSLNNLLKNTKATIALIVDETGQLIASVGKDPSKDPVLLGTLAAGNFGATSEMAKLIGEKEFTLILHEGEKENIHIAAIDNLGILVIIFDNTVKIGLIRMFVQKVIGELIPTLKIVNLQDVAVTKKEKVKIPTDDELNKLFNW
jgi:predicted regulator of Ras-like GTPase activity (Roadblock/LC7/MglB family)